MPVEIDGGVFGARHLVLTDHECGARPVIEDARCRELRRHATTRPKLGHSRRAGLAFANRRALVAAAGSLRRNGGCKQEEPGGSEGEGYDLHTRKWARTASQAIRAVHAARSTWP